MKKNILSLPNMLTYMRILSVPLVVLCFFPHGEFKPGNAARWWALAIFLIASISDFFDGYLARIWHQTSAFGRMLDPIADKLLVSACLLLLAADGTIAGWTLWAAIIILCREILVSGLREYLAELKVGVPVSKLAKWKTTLQLIALSFLLLGPAGNKIFPPAVFKGFSVTVIDAGCILLWIAALLTLITGWDYWRAGLKHVVD